MVGHFPPILGEIPAIPDPLNVVGSGDENPCERTETTNPVYPPAGEAPPPLSHWSSGKDHRVESSALIFLELSQKCTARPELTLSSAPVAQAGASYSRRVPVAGESRLQPFFPAKESSDGHLRPPVSGLVLLARRLQARRGEKAGTSVSGSRGPARLRMLFRDVRVLRCAYGWRKVPRRPRPTFGPCGSGSGTSGFALGFRLCVFRFDISGSSGSLPARGESKPDTEHTENAGEACCQRAPGESGSRGASGKGDADEPDCTQPRGGSRTGLF
ncbi:uncharacterized protein LOC125353601 [Perognathus longimembris pacificus]|uniref:uncharacterized protein LOC125353601 n=1 Tax=Perognathus longimembris pacificus TaxID=214514 RepID=UPI002018FFC0|nr:uncharacterized protein LOC125353601 [Perognathus longimembris pacificus]